MKFILGRKLNMTQIYDASGAAIAVTAVAVRGNVVTQIRTKDNDGYEALQIGDGREQLRVVDGDIVGAH